mgnify:CR=1 FL=1
MTTFQIRKTADLLDEGMPRRQVDRLSKVPGMVGVRLVGDPPDDERLVRIHAAWSRAPEGAVLAGWAAAVLHGVPKEFLDGMAGHDTPRPVDLCVPESAGAYDTRGLRPRRSRVPERQRMQLGEVIVTDPMRTALDLARWVRADTTRLAMLDLSARFGLIDKAAFADFLEPLGGLHRLNSVRELVPLLSARAESVPESETRLHWLHAELPTPVVNQPLHDRFGEFVARVDLFDPESGLAAEYQGFWHDLDLAPELDGARIGRLRSMNVTVVEIRKEDRDRVEDLLLAGYAQARARDRRMDAWTCRSVEDI